MRARHIFDDPRWPIWLDRIGDRAVRRVYHSLKIVRDARLYLASAAHTMHVTKPVPFSIEQLEALTRWSEKRPWGLSVAIATDHAKMDEVAELWREDRRLPRYTLVRYSSGLIEVASIYTLPEWAYDLRTALALVEGLERAAACVTE